MRAIDVIRTKRDGQKLSSEEIQTFVTAAAAVGSHTPWEDYQLTAMLMAIWLRGMDDQETAILTGCMTDSGKRYNWGNIPGPKVDKHSTGGVGDKTSLILAPIAACCGMIVPMMSGRGLGHSGGTLDKLESIAGFRVSLSEDELREALEKLGVAMIGQTAEVAPADRKLYMLRDATGTVESVPLITASILSKKLAEGIDSLVMDVKVGVGAFMKTLPEARSLAKSIVAVGNANGVRTEALITRMDAPLGLMVGNALEVRECISVLRGMGPRDVTELSVELAARMIALGKKIEITEARSQANRALESGEAFDKFRAMIEQQGGDPWVCDDMMLLPLAPMQRYIKAADTGFVTELNAYQIGVGSTVLGAGRARAADHIDHAVGVHILAPVGAFVQAGDPVLEIHYSDPNKLAAALPLFESSVKIGEVAPMMESLIVEEVV